MNEQYVRNVVEAAMLAAGRPLSLEELTALFGASEFSNEAAVRQALSELTAEYDTRGVEIREVATGFRIQIRANVSEPVSKLWQERPAKYSRALLETLALVAYRQPITRGEIEQIRGVTVNPNIIKTLLERSWIRVVGHRDVPGRPELLGTTRDFLDYFGLKKLDDLPTLVQLKEMEDLRVQLALPGAEPLTLVADADASEPAVEPAVADCAADAATDDDEAESSGDDGNGEDEATLRSRARGMVASGPDSEA